MKNIELVHFVEWKKIPAADFEKTLKDLAGWGVSSLVAHPCWGMKDETEPEYFEKCEEMLKKYGFKTPACHAYWGKGNDISPEDPADLETILPRHKVFLGKLARLGVESYTMHIAIKEAEADSWKTISRALDHLLPEARRCNICLALENGNENCAAHKLLADFVASRNDPFLGVCFDTGHAHCYGDREWERSLEILAPHIVTCHLHDNYGSFDDHNPPGEGNINWSRMSTALKALPRLFHAETESGNWGRDSWNRFVAIWNS